MDILHHLSSVSSLLSPQWHRHRQNRIRLAPGRNWNTPKVNVVIAVAMSGFSLRVPPPTGPNTKQYPNYAFTSAPNRSGPWSILGRKGGNQKSYWKPGSTGTEKAGTERRQGWWVGPAPKGDPGGRLGTPPPRQVCGTAWGMCVECRPCCRIRAWPRGGMPVWFGPIHR